jgi:hypothetical protein
MNIKNKKIHTLAGQRNMDYEKLPAYFLTGEVSATTWPL